MEHAQLARHARTTSYAQKDSNTGEAQVRLAQPCHLLPKAAQKVLYLRTQTMSNCSLQICTRSTSMQYARRLSKPRQGIHV